VPADLSGRPRDEDHAPIVATSTDTTPGSLSVMRIGKWDVRPLGGPLGCLVMIAISILLSVLLTVILNLVLR
jgi:hypothetical protein